MTTETGSHWMQLDISRTRKGVLVHVRVLPPLEDFIASVCKGSEPIDTFGHQWLPAVDNEVLRLRTVYEPLPDHAYTFDSPCMSLVTVPPGKRVEVPNLTFLRFEGVSSPDGVKFIITGPINRDAIRLATRKISEGTRQFIMDYVAPVNVSLKISTQEV